MQENELSGESEDLLKDDFVNELNEGSSGSSNEGSSDSTATERHEDEKQLAGEKKGFLLCLPILCAILKKSRRQKEKFD